MIELKFPEDGAEISLQTDVQKKFSSEKEREKRSELGSDLNFAWYDLERKGYDLTRPLPVSFSWEYDYEDESVKCEESYFYLLISEDHSMTSPLVYSSNQNFCDVFNLKIGTDYFWCVQRNGKRSEISHFRTVSTLPRCLKIDCIPNVRDMGGYETDDGHIIRQGLVYRGSEFERHVSLSPEGALELMRLGIRTELDMREEARGNIDFSTPELFGIRRIFVPSVPYDSVFSEDQHPALNEFFSVFADIDNYPIYYHCWGGADRTGTFAFILGAFLGMKYEDLIFEYEFTSLSVWGVRSRNYEGFVRFIKSFNELDGTDLRQKSICFLKNHAGMTDRNLSDIYDFLTEKK